MQEIAPGVHHWTAHHPDIGMRVSCHYIEPAGIVLDPLEPEDGWGFFDALDRPPRQVVLTSCLHWRHSDRFRERCGATIRAPAPGLHRWEGTDREAEPYDVGDEIAPGVVALEIGGIAPDDMALHIQHGAGAIAFADALVMPPDGALAYMPDFLWDDPPTEQEAVRDSLRGVLERDFDALLFAHGYPIASGGHSTLGDFVANPVVMPDFRHTT
jgi:glyoxylase-like metal-dependent hydrolase (beta-lactamase superfamily II)